MAKTRLKTKKVSRSKTKSRQKEKRLTQRERARQKKALENRLSPKVKQASKEGLSIPQLMRNTPAYVHARATDVRVFGVKREVVNETLPIIRAQAKSAPTKINPKPVIHRLMMMPVDIKSDTMGSNKNRVWISCDCQWHCFFCEVALFRLGASDIIFSNGKRPNVTNPHMVPMVCKHAIEFFKKIKNKRW